MKINYLISNSIINLVQMTDFFDWFIYLFVHLYFNIMLKDVLSYMLFLLLF